MCHESFVTCHLSMSRANLYICIYIYFFSSFLQMFSLVKLIGWGSVINKATPYSLSYICLNRPLRFDLAQGTFVQGPLRLRFCYGIIHLLWTKVNLGVCPTLVLCQLFMVRFEYDNGPASWLTKLTTQQIHVWILGDSRQDMYVFQLFGMDQVL